MTPTQISDYRIASQLSAGGMGEVYLTQDTRFKRRVTFKFPKDLPPMPTALLSPGGTAPAPRSIIPAPEIGNAVSKAEGTLPALS